MPCDQEMSSVNKIADHTDIEFARQEQSLLAVRDDLARSERTLDQNLVRLYRALGGGWEAEQQVAQGKFSR
jgi:outer membrane protein TolC